MLFYIKENFEINTQKINILDWGILENNCQGQIQSDNK